MGLVTVTNRVATGTEDIAVTFTGETETLVILTPNSDQYPAGAEFTLEYTLTPPVDPSVGTSTTGTTTDSTTATSTDASGQFYPTATVEGLPNG